jgi:ferritin
MVSLRHWVLFDIFAILGILSAPHLGASGQGSCPETKTCNQQSNEASESDLSLHVPWRLSDYPHFAITDSKLTTAMNTQVNLELQISYIYLSMANYFARDTQALPGFSAFFKRYSREEMEHAHQMIDFLTRRGALVMLGNISPPCDAQQQLFDAPDISKPTSAQDDTEGCNRLKMAVTKTSKVEVDGKPLYACDWKNPLNAVTAVRQAELANHKHLRKVHALAEKLHDTTLMDFPDKFLTEQVDEIKELTDLITQLQRVEACLGHYLIDRDLQEKSKTAIAHV